MRCIQNYTKNNFISHFGAIIFHYASIKTQNLETNQNLDQLNVCQSDKQAESGRKKERTISQNHNINAQTNTNDNEIITKRIKFNTNADIKNSILRYTWLCQMSFQRLKIEIIST